MPLKTTCMEAMSFWVQPSDPTPVDSAFLVAPRAAAAPGQQLEQRGPERRQQQRQQRRRGQGQRQRQRA